MIIRQEPAKHVEACDTKHPNNARSLYIGYDFFVDFHFAFSVLANETQDIILLPIEDILNSQTELADCLVFWKTRYF